MPWSRASRGRTSANARRSRRPATSQAAVRRRQVARLDAGACAASAISADGEAPGRRWSGRCTGAAGRSSAGGSRGSRRRRRAGRRPSPRCWPATCSTSSRMCELNSTVRPSSPIRLQQVHQVQPLPRVHAVERLVEQQHRRVVHQRGRHLDALPHALGVGADLAVLRRRPSRPVSSARALRPPGRPAGAARRWPARTPSR